ncbi:type I restriction endonuclease subunit R [Aerococcus tenax]|uniref:Type I restriction endonuclease subunit R n=1 Tax=Aerococcus tenax TaxID=3078812 RepID=A0A5N1BJT8_9LACT|nr:DEAD/DEAH box helicase family protein [Aerococcus urinae]KAA9240375.1 type I restriction endonuclease subunit R [Aerococcus urinae]
MPKLPKIFDERYEFQAKFVDHLVNENQFIERKNKDFNRSYAMDTDLLFDFLYKTQEDVMAELEAIFKADLRETLVNFINGEITKKGSFLIDVFKNGIEISNRKLELMYTKPATDFNKDLYDRYESNIFSVMQEVIPTEGERVDLVIFLNGLAIMSFELKSEYSGQTYRDAIKQYRLERDPKSRLFLWKAGCFVNFAMDTNQVMMATKLDGQKTFFLPFNQGKGEGIYTGAGNPQYEDKLSVAYMWEDILTKDSILELIKKFIFIERKEVEDEFTDRTKIKETLIFPRFHQLDLIRKILADVKENKTRLNYLIQHSAGSGKTNSIAWLSHRLVSLHDADNRVIYDSIVIVTDRVVVDRQLQKAVMSLDHANGLIRTMGDDCSSYDLKVALEGNTKIVVTTIQKFPYIVDQLTDLKEKNFAVIIDEAHSSTAGKNMQAVTQALGSDGADYEDEDDIILDQIKKSGKQDNVSMFAFTATPKPTTLRMFGRLNKNGNYEAFHLYSMKQAIEEGFILDVLQNYTTYETMYRINKEVEDDPELKTSQAKRQIARFIELHDTNISQRLEIIIEHFKNNVMTGLGGQAKAMVVTSSRPAAVKYAKAFDAYVKKKGYDGIRALVAFSGKVHLDDDETVYTEVGMNKMSEDRVPSAFDSDLYNVMIVANKYQTGFDQKKLSAMYVTKRLRGVNAVQTLSRLNRVCPPFDKKVFVLDFTNDYEDIKAAFAPYYTTTLLASDLSANKIKDLLTSLEAYNIIDPLDVERLNTLVFKKRKGNIRSNEQKSLMMALQNSNRRLKEFREEDQRDFVAKMRNFKRFYEYLIQVSCFEDVEVHRYYIYISYFLDIISLNESGDGFDLKGKVKADNFVQRKTESYVDEQLISKPIVNLPVAEPIVLPEDKKERLSEIIADINAKTGADYDVDLATNAAMQVRDIMLKSEELKTSAKNNTESDFKFSYFSNVEDALIEGLGQNQGFFGYLLNNPEEQKEVLGIFMEEIYESLRAETR